MELLIEFSFSFFLKGLFKQSIQWQPIQNFPFAKHSQYFLIHFVFVQVQQFFSCVSCTCSKSFCNKKYCECYKSGRKCSDKCRCLHCLNGNNNELNYINDDIYCKECKIENNLSEIKPEDFTMQTTSVFISKNKTIIEVEKKGKDDMKLISLKRN